MKARFNPPSHVIPFNNIFSHCHFWIWQRWVCCRSAYLCSLGASTLSWLSFLFLFPLELIPVSHKIRFFLMLCEIEYMSKLHYIIIVQTALYILRCLIIVIAELLSSVVNPMPSFLHRPYSFLDQTTVAFLAKLTDPILKCITLLVSTNHRILLHI